MYSGKIRTISFLDSKGVLCRKKMASIPCHYCGIIVPLSHITVDHKAPSLEKTPNRRGYAVLKTLRALSNYYTVAPGEGKKSIIAQSTLVGIPHDPPMVPTKMNRVASTTPGSRANRDKITEKGILFFNIANLYFGNGSRMYNYDHFVHTFLNLAPVCSHCNSSKQENRGTFIPKPYQFY